MLDKEQQLLCLERRIAQLEHTVNQLRIGRRVLMNLLVKNQEEKTRLEEVLAQSNCFSCCLRQRALRPNQK